MDKEFSVLKEVAQKLAGDTVVSDYVRCGHVACAMLTDKGNVYTGISINAKCGIGFCAEHSAIADMLKAGEKRIVKLVAASENSVVVSCGRCLEFIRQLDSENVNTKILLPNAKEGDIIKIEIDKEGTEERRKYIQELMNKVFED